MSDKKVLRTRIGDQMVKVTIREEDGEISTSTKIESAIIPWDDLMSRAKVEADTYETDPPWRHWDGHEHRLIEADELTATDREGHTIRHYNRDHTAIVGCRQVVIVDREQAKEWGVYDPSPGQSKQLAYEKGERLRREAIEQIVQWYQHGWIWFTASLRFKGYEASIGGFLGSDSGLSDEEETEAKESVAAEVACEMKADGYQIVGRPPRTTEQEGFRNRFARRLGFGSYEAWKADLLRRRPPKKKNTRRRIVRPKDD